MAITPDKNAIEAAGLEYIEPHEIVKDTGPKALNLLAQAVVDGLGGVNEAEVRAIVEGMDLGATPDAVASALGLWPVASESPPPSTMYGVPVVWFDTSAPKDPAQWYPAAPTIDNEGKQVIIPADAGASYTVNGVTKSAGAHPIDTSGGTVSITVVAVPKPGYTFASAATARWTGAITAGLRLLVDDTLTSGEWVTGRPTGVGSNTWSVRGTADGWTFDSLGLTSTAHLKNSYGDVATGGAASATIELDYERPAGNGAIAFGITVSHPVNASSSTPGQIALTGSGFGFNLSTSGTSVKHSTPPTDKGHARVEFVGKDIKAYVDDVLCWTGTLDNEARYDDIRVGVMNSSARIKNVKVWVS